ncbi:MAG TPA: alanine/glycine:cation symporter family protein [Woeseiaceae bacterium]|nr:alanine/glycine:cation symporter family protein [Woeseiaceae bacterium]
MRSIYATIFLLLLSAVSTASEPAGHPSIAAQATAEAEAAAAIVVPDKKREGVMEIADDAMGAINDAISTVLFYDLAFWDNGEQCEIPAGARQSPCLQVPFVVLWLVTGGVFLTLRMGFFNFRGFRHAIALVRGKYTDPSEPGDVSHFQALSCALSATVGLGNIAGVAIAVTLGGPGATFWMIVAGLIGMTTKFSECTLALMYREFRSDSRVLGGPVQYLSKGFAERGLPRLGKGLAILFAFLCIGGSIAGGNAFQVNQSMNAVQETMPWLQNWVYGLVMTVLVGIVILGGIRRIANVADKVVPFMAIFYVVGCLVVIMTNAELVPAALARIFTEAFSPNAAFGGIVGVLVVGFQRAAFSNEAGAGSAAIAHSAAKTKFPIREGTVALLEPFIDTVIICTMTALVISITGAYDNPAYTDLIQTRQGAALTSRAFGEEIAWFPYVLSLAVFLFAYSTMLSWSYYGERCAVWLFGERASKYYKMLFLAFTFLGSVITAINILEFGDLMILGMSLPNLIGVYLLHGKVRAALTDYWKRYKAGEFPVFESKADVATATPAPATETEL